MNKDLISRDVLRKRMNQYVFPITTNNLMGAADAYYRILHIVDELPSVKSFPSFDISANALLGEAVSDRNIRFRETDEMCPQCQRDLEVYYCENRTYAVRCKHCKTVTLVQAQNPYKAAEKVGLHGEFRRHGYWISQDNTRTKFMCSDCKSRNHDGSGKYCSQCGCKMDAEVEG